MHLRGLGFGGFRLPGLGVGIGDPSRAIYKGAKYPKKVLKVLTAERFIIISML